MEAIGDAHEAQAVGRLLIENVARISWADALCGGLQRLLPSEQERLEIIVRLIEEGKPVQYAIGWASFCGRSYEVTPAVLIPRPETEELCQWITNDVKDSADHEEQLSILDIGTGSGCIAITLALAFPKARVSAIDISEEALSVARRNAQRLNATVDFVCKDILTPQTDDMKVSIIASNPPYVTESEKKAMQPQVVNHEPHQALFVPDDDSLLFYRAIAQKATHMLLPQGRLYFEINPLFSSQLSEMVKAMGYQQITIRRDSFGHERFLRATLPLPLTRSPLPAPRSSKNDSLTTK